MPMFLAKFRRIGELGKPGSEFLVSASTDDDARREAAALLPPGYEVYAVALHKPNKQGTGRPPLR